MGFELGQTLGTYEFLEVLASSANGVSYKVRNLAASRLEVLKALPDDSSQLSHLVERFQREAAIHSRLAHPNIAEFYGTAELAGQLVMTRELLQGTTLTQRLAAGPISLTDGLDYMCQVLSALGYAHQQGVVHRYITPDSVVITPRNVVKIPDFQLALDGDAARVTLPGTVIGGLQYVAPEQVMESKQVDGRSDLYSLGAVLYELSTGRRLFEIEDPYSVLVAHVNQDPIPPARIKPSLPPKLNQAILTALAKEPSDRFQDAGQFQRELRAVRAMLRPQPGAAGPSRGRSSRQ